MRISLVIILSLTTLPISAQYYSDQEISRDQFKPWVVDSVQEYSSVYLFGFSEGECELRIFVDKNIIAAQRSCYTWRDSLGGFIDTFYNFNNVRIEGNKFYSDETNGEFLILTDNSGTHNGLLLYRPWTYQFYKGGEFGSVMPDAEYIYLPGDYPQGSTRLLSSGELQKLSSQQLKVIRNEIYARYGYIFTNSGDMEKYFSGKKWYLAKYESVNDWLTEIEQRNIETIRRVEKERQSE